MNEKIAAEDIDVIATDFEIEPGSDLQTADRRSINWRGNIKYFFVGILFGILLVKAEIISWFRIQEMFRFQSFHMYGVIGSAIIVGAISILLIKRLKTKTWEGETIDFPVKKFHKGQIFGGLLFGFGWALTGACPGPIFAQIGSGFIVVIFTLISAIAGTWVYGLIRDRLPH